eukprot:m51a1_g12122 hypothetical protein (104) ;mRNA; r:4520-4882
MVVTRGNTAAIHFGFNGTEVVLNDFEVLVGESPRWSRVYPEFVISGKHAGMDRDNQPLFVARITYNDGTHAIGKTGAHLQGINIVSGGREIHVAHQPFEVIIV